jgi:hypothetical protein
MTLAWVKNQRVHAVGRVVRPLDLQVPRVSDVAEVLFVT